MKCLEFFKLAARSYGLDLSIKHHLVGQGGLKSQSLPSNVKDKFEHSFTSNGDLIIFRPYLGELLKFLYKNKAKIGLWTYSDQEYAEAITKTIKDKYKLKKNTFMFIKSDEHMEHETLNQGGLYPLVLDLISNL